MNREIPEKQEARRLARERRRAIPASDKEKFDQLITKRLCGLLADRKALVSVLCYVSLPEEVSTREFIGEALAGHVKLSVPRVSGDSMSFYEINSADDLEPGYMGIPEPKSYCRKAAPAAGSAVIMPGLAFTGDGKRLGYGGGFYDRFLAGHPGLIKIALAYSAQLFDDFENDPTDIRPDFIITEQGIISVTG